MAVALVGGDVATARSTGDVDLILEPIDPSLPAQAVLRVSCLGQWSCRCAGALMQATGTEMLMADKRPNSMFFVGREG
jgi:hypothetical protein